MPSRRCLSNCNVELPSGGRSRLQGFQCVMEMVKCLKTSGWLLMSKNWAKVNRQGLPGRRNSGVVSSGDSQTAPFDRALGRYGRQLEPDPPQTTVSLVD